MLVKIRFFPKTHILPYKYCYTTSWNINLEIWSQVIQSFVQVLFNVNRLLLLYEGIQIDVNLHTYMYTYDIHILAATPIETSNGILIVIYRIVL